MKIHFIGIGGIGVSALSQYYLALDHQVSGSDLISSEITDFLKEKGVKIFIGKHKAKNLPQDTDLVIYSSAVSFDNPELRRAKKGKIKIKSYPQALGELTKKYFTIAVSGTHGKSTTAAMISLILIKAGFDPIVVIGTKLREFDNSNFRIGRSKYLVIEADEWQASFLNYFPQIIVLTNIEREHLDFYKNLKNILKTYKKYIEYLPKGGVLVANGEDSNIQKIIRDRISCGGPISLYRLRQKETKKLKRILKVPGKHNVYNSLAALTVARALKVPDRVSFQALSEYKGAWRRFEIKKFQVSGFRFQVISDYAHHPTEIQATLKTAREKWPQKRIWAVFQPHQYQRTYYLWDDFVKAFDLADKVIITKIYEVAGREQKKISKKINSQKLAEAIGKRGKETYFIEDFEKIPYFLKNKVKSGDIILIMGAGDIYKLAENIRRSDLREYKEIGSPSEIRSLRGLTKIKNKKRIE